MEENGQRNINEVAYGLYDYQADATENIADIYSSENGHNKFAGVILPTGGGKSFVAIQELLASVFDENGEFRQRTNEEIAKLDRTGVINSSPLLYVAPSHEILSQVKLHIVKNVLFGIPELATMSVDEIDTLVRSNFPDLNFPGVNAPTGNENVSEVTDSSSRSEKVQAILRHIGPTQINMLVKNAFPGLQFKCYAGMKDKTQDQEDVLTESDIENEFALVILDEAHRVGASTWNENIKNLISKSQKGKILAITATPERTDKDKKDMMQEIAKMAYPGETVVSDEYIAKEIIVLDAMRDGIVTSPKLIDYPAALAESAEYREIRRKLETCTVKKEKAELQKIIDQMHEIIGFVPPYKDADKGADEEIGDTEELVQTEQEEIEEDRRIAEVLKENLTNPNGKYIAFIPSNTGEKDDLLSSAEVTQAYFDKWKARIERQFADSLGVKPQITFVTSNTQVQSAAVNSQVLKEFDDASNETGGIKILIAIDKLNEGVHVDGIDGSFMYRPIGRDSSTLFLQQSGRCISSMDTKVKTAEDFEALSKRQIFDFRANAFKQINNNIGARVSRKYDLEKITDLSRTIEELGRVPDPNSSDLKEARAAIALKRIAEKYESFANGEIPSTLKDKDKIAEIIRIANDMKLWEMEIPERTVEPSEVELTGSDFLSYSDSQRRFMELYNEAKSVSKKREIPADVRVRKLINVLRVLKARKPDIELPGGIMIKGTPQEKKKLGIEPLSLDELLNQNFDPSEIDKILVEFEDMDRVGAESRRDLYHRGEQYDIAQELAFVRGLLWTSQTTYEKTGIESVFARYAAYELVKLDIIDSRHPERLKEELNTVFGVRELTDAKGNIKYSCPEASEGFGVIESIAGRNLATGERYIYGYDAEGYDRDGYDVYGYDRRGFNREKTKNILTGAAYDDRGFKWDKEGGKWIHIKTKDEFDPLGYNIDGVDKDGFELPMGPQKTSSGAYYSLPLWHKKLDDGYERIGRKLNPETGKDAHGFRYPNGVAWGYYGDTGKIDTVGGFWSNGATTQKPYGIDEYYHYTGLDMDGFDENGFKEVMINGKKQKIHRDTSMEYDKNGKIESVLSNGKVVLRDHLAVNHAIVTLKMLVEEGKSIDDVYKIFATTYKCSVAEAQTRLGNSLSKFAEITRIAPNVLEHPELKKYLANPTKSPQRKEQIHKFYEMAPRFSLRIKNEAKENLRRIECLRQREERLNEYGRDAVSRGDQEEITKVMVEIAAGKAKQTELTQRNADLKEYDDPYDR